MPLSEDEELELLILEQEERARGPRMPDTGRKQRANEARQNAARASVEAEQILAGPSTLDELEAALVGATDNLSMGWGDEASGLWEAVKNPRDLKGAYLRGVDERRALTQEAQELAPTAYGTGDLAATLGSALIPGAKAAMAPSLGKAVMRGAGLGAAAGGVAGAGHADGDPMDRLTGAATGAGTGALFGSLLGGAGHKLVHGSIGKSSGDATPPPDVTQPPPSASPMAPGLRERAMAAARAFIPDRFKKAAQNVQTLDELVAAERARGGFVPDPVGADIGPTGQVGTPRGFAGSPEAPWLDPEFQQMRPASSPEQMVVEPVAMSAQLDDLQKALADTRVRKAPQPPQQGSPEAPWVDPTFQPAESPAPMPVLHTLTEQLDDLQGSLLAPRTPRIVSRPIYEKSGNRGKILGYEKVDISGPIPEIVGKNPNAPDTGFSISAEDLASMADVPHEGLVAKFPGMAGAKKPSPVRSGTQVDIKKPDESSLFPPSKSSRSSIGEDNPISDKSKESTQPGIPKPKAQEQSKASGPAKKSEEKTGVVERPSTPTGEMRDLVKRRIELEEQKGSIDKETYDVSRQALAMQRKKAGPKLLMQKGPEGAIRWVLENAKPADEKEAAAMAGLSIRQFREKAQEFGIDISHLRKPDLGRFTPKKG